VEEWMMIQCQVPQRHKMHWQTLDQVEVVVDTKVVVDLELMVVLDLS
tara:strand:+ start:434 stop:574 length:141 start_codon:yes stop_codon:yes gene_type:complete